MYRYSGLIKCSLCGKNFKRKKLRSRIAYVCSKYDNKSECKRIPIKEEYLDELIEMRYRRKLSDQEIWEEVKSIEVGEDKIQINYKSEQEPTIITDNFGQF